MSFIGKIINNKYQILSLLGEGGMSYVFKASEIGRGRTVAVKFMKDKMTSTYLEDLIRFKRQIEIISRLNHPNITKIYDTGEFENKPYIVMECLAGQNLKNMIEKIHLSENECVEIIRQLAQALDYVHGRGVIHRDLKPANIVVTDQKHRVVKLLDFGVAHIIELRTINEPKAIIGTFGYMSPEAVGVLNTRVDERSDLYSLGIVFYHLLTGELPFKETTVNKLVHQQVAAPPLRPGEIKGGVAPILDEVIMKLIRKDPELRYQSAKGLLYDLERYQQGERWFKAGEKDQKIKLTYQTRLIGREKEIKRLKELFQSASAGKGSICLIAGEAGIGKSRLVDEIRGYVYENTGLFLKGRCINSSNKTPYQPFKDVLDEYLREFENANATAKEKEMNRFNDIPGGLEEIVIQLNPRMEKILKSGKKRIPLEPERENQRFLMALSDLFCRLADQNRVCVLFLDDLQWLDEGSFNLLGEILKKINDSSLFLVGTYRDNEIGENHGLTRILSAGYPLELMKLSSFTDHQLNDLLCNIMVGIGDNPPDVMTYIREKSGGNPFFAIQIVKELIENKALVWNNSSWVKDKKKLKATTIPDNIVDIILQRTKSLTPDQNTILCKGAVIGKEFELELLFKLTNYHQVDLIQIIDELIILQLLERSLERGKLLFVHDRIRDAFYHKIGLEERRKIHQEVAAALEDIHQGAETNVIFNLLHHYIESGNRTKVLQYIIPAADLAKASYANEAALNYYEMALNFLEESGKKGESEWIGAAESIIDVYLTIGSMDEVITIATEILPLLGTELAKAKVYKKIGIAYFKKGDWTQCEQNLAQGLRLLGETLPRNKPAVLLSIIKEFGIHLFHGIYLKSSKKNDIHQERYQEIIWNQATLNWMYILSDIQKFVCNILRVLNLSEKKLHGSNEHGLGLCAFAILCTTQAFFKNGMNYHYRAFRLREKLGDEWGVAQSLQLIGFSLNWQGNYMEAINKLTEAQERFQKIGDLWELAMVCNCLGQAFHHLADYNESMVYKWRYLEISENIKDYYGMAAALTLIGRNYIEMGMFAEAKEPILKAMEISKKNGIWFMFCYATIQMGFWESEQNNSSKAIIHLEEARRLEKENQFLQDYVVFLYPQLAEAYLKKYDDQVCNENYIMTRSEQNYIYTLCREALKRTRVWVNHYGIALRAMANYYRLTRKNYQAEKYYGKSISHHQKINRRFELAKSYYEYGTFLKRNQRFREAENNWYLAHQLFTQIGVKGYIQKCKEALGIHPNEVLAPEMDTRDRLMNSRRMNTVIMTSGYLSSILDHHELLEKILDNAIELVGAEKGILLLYPEEGGRQLEAKVVRNVSPEELPVFETSVSSSIISRIEHDQIPVLITDALLDSELKDQASIVTYGIRSIIATPIMAKSGMLGVIYLDSSLLGGLFTREDLNILNIISNQAGISIENARLYGKLKIYLAEIEKSRDNVAQWNRLLEEQVSEQTKELAEKNEELDAMLAQLKKYTVAVEELAITKERNRFAMDVHDTLGNTLALLIKQLEASALICHKDPDKAERKLQEAIQVGREGLKELKRSIFGLAPEKLEANNLIKGLTRLFDDFRNLGMHIDFSVIGIYDYRNPVYSFVLYKVCQEALTNSLRHGKAKNVTVILRFADDRIRMIIIDDGCGCKQITKGFGMMGMEQRIQDLSGSISYSTDGESEFTVRIELPIGDDLQND